MDVDTAANLLWIRVSQLTLVTLISAPPSQKISDYLTHLAASCKNFFLFPYSLLKPSLPLFFLTYLFILPMRLTSFLSLFFNLGGGTHLAAASQAPQQSCCLQVEEKVGAKNTAWIITWHVLVWNIMGCRENREWIYINACICIVQKWTRVQFLAFVWEQWLV